MMREFVLICGQKEAIPVAFQNHINNNRSIKNKALLCGAFIAAVVFAGCADKNSTKSEQDKGKPHGRAAAELLKPKVKVGIDTVNKAWQLEVRDDLKPMVAEAPDWQSKFLNQWMEQEVLAEMARRKRIDKTDEFKIFLEVRATVLLAKLYERDYITPELNKIKARPDEVDAFYEDHKRDMFFNDRFFVGWRVVSHIVLDEHTDPTSIYQELKNDPGKFAAYAKEYSTDTTTGANGGDLGQIRVGDPRIHPAVVPAYFFTPKGEISQPTPGPTGWHLVYVRDASPEQEDFLPLNELRRIEVSNALLYKKKEEKRTQMIDKLRKEMRVKVHKEMIKEIAPDWAKKGKRPAGKEKASDG